MRGSVIQRFCHTDQNLPDFLTAWDGQKMTVLQGAWIKWWRPPAWLRAEGFGTGTSTTCGLLTGQEALLLRREISTTLPQLTTSKPKTPLKRKRKKRRASRHRSHQPTLPQCLSRKSLISCPFYKVMAKRCFRILCDLKNRSIVTVLFLPKNSVFFSLW